MTQLGQRKGKIRMMIETGWMVHRYLLYSFPFCMFEMRIEITLKQARKKLQSFTSHFFDFNHTKNGLKFSPFLFLKFSGILFALWIYADSQVIFVLFYYAPKSKEQYFQDTSPMFSIVY